MVLHNVSNYMSRHMTSPHLISPHLTSHHITSRHITSRHITYHIISSHRITSHHIRSHRVTYRVSYAYASRHLRHNALHLSTVRRATSRLEHRRRAPWTPPSMPQCVRVQLIRRWMGGVRHLAGSERLSRNTTKYS